MNKISFDETRYRPPEPSEPSHTETRKRLVRSMMKECLSDRQKQILLLYFEEQKNMVEIAQILGINKSTVSRTLHRGLNNVKQGLLFWENVRKNVYRNKHKD
jgi:RNA polymerase sigma factor (sigma-70 family)